MERHTIPQVLAKTPMPQLPAIMERYFKAPVKTQDDVLMEILNMASGTEYGRKYGFAGIMSREDYVKRVPLTSWYDYSDYSQRMERGEEDVLFPGKAEYFIATTGTTGKMKLIPESVSGAAAKIAISSMRNAISIQTLLKVSGITDFSMAAVSGLGHVMALVNTGGVSITEGGIPIGYASGITGNQTDEALKRMFCYPQEILDLPDNRTVDYMIMRFALMYDDIAIVAGNNAVRLQMLVQFAAENAQLLTSDINNGTITKEVNIPAEKRKQYEKLLTPNPQRAEYLQRLFDSGSENFTPKNYWKRLGLCGFWLGGSVGAYAEQLRGLLPDKVVYLDVGYGASELKINVPVKPETPFGALGTFGGFFEFIPQNGGEPVFIDQLEDDGIYEIVITTYSGLYRYQLGDYIKVSGKTFNTPNIVFVSKKGDVAALLSEKVTGDMILRAARTAAERLKLGEFGFCQVYPRREERRYYCYFEIAGGGDADALANAFDIALQEIGSSYKLLRGNGSINCPVAIFMKKGWRQYLFEARQKLGVNISQIKLPVVIDSFPLSEYIE